jgi:hypothetical protein
MNRTYAAILILVLATGLSGCDSDRGLRADRGIVATGPSSVSEPAVVLRAFTDPATGFSTSDLRDAQDEIVQFNTANELIWAADGTHLPGYKLAASTYVECGPCAGWFEVRFGTKDGERRAYLTVDYGHDNPGSLIDLDVVGGALVARRSNVFPPGTYTLSGAITERTPTGSVPLEGVEVSRGYATGWIGATTDKNGFYEVHGLYDRTDVVSASKDGYERQETLVTVNGDTRFDMQLVRR